MPKVVLQLKAVEKSYQSPTGKLTILHGADLEIKAGERMAIVGQSGSGKSTMLHIAGTLDSANKGEVIIDGASINKLSDNAKAKLRNQKIGFIYQHHHLLAEFTALENVMMPAMVAGTKKADAKAKATQLLNDVGMSKRLEHMPSQLSGGEQQRVAIARALMNSPQILLADEPTGSLDPQTASEVSQIFDSMVKQHNMALLLVTHNMELAKQCDKVYALANGHLKKA